MGQLNIPDSVTVYADTSVFIYTVEANSNYYNLCNRCGLAFMLGQLRLSAVS